MCAQAQPALARSSVVAERVDGALNYTHLLLISSRSQPTRGQIFELGA
jgi:hypothetical protein